MERKTEESKLHPDFPILEVIYLTSTHLNMNKIKHVKTQLIFCKIMLSLYLPYSFTSETNEFIYTKQNDRTWSFF